MGSMNSVLIISGAARASAARDGAIRYCGFQDVDARCLSGNQFGDRPFALLAQNYRSDCACDRLGDFAERLLFVTTGNRSVGTGSHQEVADRRLVAGAWHERDADRKQPVAFLA